MKDLEERLRKSDQQVDVLRNALGRRDALLAEQRAAYYRDLILYKKSDVPAPASTYEKALDGPPVEERPSFFDAMVFEALHLSADTPLVQKASAALKRASVQQAEMQAKGSQEVMRCRLEVQEERKRRRDVEESMKQAVAAMEANVDAAIRNGIDDAIAEQRARHAEVRTCREPVWRPRTHSRAASPPSLHAHAHAPAAAGMARSHAPHRPVAHPPSRPHTGDGDAAADVVWAVRACLGGVRRSWSSHGSVTAS